MSCMGMLPRKLFYRKSWELRYGKGSAIGIWNQFYEYGARAGFWRLHWMFTHYDIPVTVYGVASALQRSPEQVKSMLDADWEIASHGLKWIEYKDYSKDDERYDMDEAISIHQAATGMRPKGWYTGRCSVNTVELAAEEGGFDYVSDSYADDLPYWHTHGEKDQLLIPYTLDCNDMRFATPQGFNSGDQFYAYLKDSFDTLYAEGKSGAAKMMNIGLHCRLIGRPGRAAALERFLQYAKSHDKVWFARRIDIASHWKDEHPPIAQNIYPSRINKKEFLELFGGVFEHSAWVAERTYDGELGPAHDTVTGIHAAMVIQYRSASETERLQVLTAHPDLAGKLASAKRLTKESTHEQASAGLDALTDDERKIFTQLNERYKSKFGFPFIIAVKGLTKLQIMDAFKARVDNGKDEEFNTACRQVERIALLRITDLLTHSNRDN